MARKRVGYFGLSSPALYDYKTPAPRASSDQMSSPNPIIEGVFGSMLLYDELWFLCESLCPANMRGLPYVRFVDQMDANFRLDGKALSTPENAFSAEALAAYREASQLYSTIREQIGVTFPAAADNHTHGLSINGSVFSANSWRVDNVLLDLQAVKQLGHGVELILNSFTARLFDTQAEQAAKMRLAEMLVLNNIPNYLTPQGPYHECIEDVRNDTFLSDFRKWIANTKVPIAPSELREQKEKVERKLEESERDVFVKYLAPSTGYKTLGKTMIGMAVGMIPGGGAVTDLVELGGQLMDEKVKQEIRWQGFIASARGKVKDAIR